MRRRLGAYAGVVAALVACAHPALAYFEQVAIGARGLSLGASTLASVRDASASYWNPAALALIPERQILIDYAKPFGLDGADEGSVAFCGRAFGLGLGFSWHHLGVANVYGEDLFTLAAARTVARPAAGHSVAAGAAFKYGRIGFQPFSVEGQSVDYGSQAKGSADLALLWTTPWQVDLSWTGRDVASPRYELVPGSGGGELPFRNEIGAAFRWNRESTVTAAWSQIDASGATSLNVGLELWFFDVFALRSGLTNLSPIVSATGSPNEFQFTGGIGIHHRGYHFDAVAFTNHDLGASYRATFQAPLGRSEAP